MEYSNIKPKYSDIILLNKDLKILLLKRIDTDNFMPGRWCLPGGHNESDADDGINARRECYEETNIVCTSTKKLFIHEFETGDSSRIFLAKEGRDFSLIRRQIELAPREHSEYKWFSLKEAIDLQLMPQLDIILIKAQSYF